MRFLFQQLGEREEIHKKTFRKWINTKLAMVSHSLFKRYGSIGSVLQYEAVGKLPVTVKCNDISQGFANCVGELRCERA